MKILCVLQNAWGDGRVPLVFKPNPQNKSAKNIKKMVSPHTFYFSNTTGEVTISANMRAKPDYSHFKELLSHFKYYDLILVCGTQAKNVVHKFLKECQSENDNILFVPHPAYRALSKVMISDINKLVNNTLNGEP